MLCFKAALLSALLLVPVWAQSAPGGNVPGSGGSLSGMQPLEDEEMSSVTGEGIALALEDIRVTMSPTSFVELSGTEPSADVADLFDRGDLRWYGHSITGTEGADSWAGSCGQGLLDMGCPLGGTVGQMAPHDNPLLLRVFNHEELDFQGQMADRTVLELLWPSSHEAYRFSFWGEMKFANDPNDVFQVQNIFNNIIQNDTKLRLFQHSDDEDPTLALIYENHFAGDVRWSVNQSLSSPDSFGQVPEFTDREGLYFEDYRVFFPMGQMHYQAVIFDDVLAQDGNFIINQTRVPNRQVVYNHFYGRSISDDPTGGYDRSIHAQSDSYHRTHGFVRWGDWRGGDVIPNPPYDNPDAPRANEPVEGAGQCMPDRVGCSRNTPTSTDGGMFFAARAGNTFQPEVRGNYFDAGPGGTPEIAPQTVNAVNLGDSRVEGLLIQNLDIRTLGAGP